MTIRNVAAGVTVVLCLTAGSAAAADLPSRAPPPVFVPPAPVFTWTGFYIGGYGGYSFEGDVKLTSAIGSLTAKRQGFTAGGLAGYNYQIGSIVLGLEGDAGYDGERARASFLFNPLVAPPFTVNVREKSDGFVGRARGRIGFAAGNFFLGETLIYAAGGGSFLRESFTFSALGGSASVSKDRVGFNIGGGVEVAFSPHWLARVEYIYDDYGSENYPALGFGLPFRAKLTDNTVRGALEYKF